MPLVPILHDMGLAMGTLPAFMMNVVALSLPEVILLRRVLEPRLLAAFAAGIVAVGYLFNATLSSSAPRTRWRSRRGHWHPLRKGQ